MFKKFIALIIISFSVFALPLTTFAAGGIYAYGGGSKNVGETFTVTVTANGTTFDALQGTINVSGPVSVVSFSGGGATWLPGKTPAAGKEFIGITSRTNSLTVATIRLQGTKAGSGSVSVSGVKLALDGAIAGTSGGSVSFTINRALTPPGEIKVTSTTHPDSNQSYDAKTIELAWDKPSGVTDFSTAFDQIADTTPGTTATTSEITASQTVEKIGVYYFHIRAKNADGWGPATHFKVTIKAAVDNSLAKTTATVEKTSDFKISLEDGTVTGAKFKGQALKDFTVTLSIIPVTEGLTLATIAGQKNEVSPSPVASESPTTTESTNPAVSPETATPSPTPLIVENRTEMADWEIIANKPLKAGFYKFVAQAQAGELLTPPSDEVMFEITLANGGDIHILTTADLNPGSVSAKQIKILGIDITNHPLRWTAVFTAIFLLIVAMIAYIARYYIRKRLSKKSYIRPDSNSKISIN